MKKQVRILYFALIVMMMLCLSVIASSAATEGNTSKENAHAFSVETGSGIKYYTTLDLAVENVKDGGVIKMLAHGSSSWNKSATEYMALYNNLINY